MDILVSKIALKYFLALVLCGKSTTTPPVKPARIA